MAAVKCVVVGDGAVGKTCMLITYTENRFPSGYVPTVFENYETFVNFKGKAITFSLWDTAGQEEYQKLRVLSYPKTDVFLLCFSVVHPLSYESIRDHWVSEVKEYSPRTPYILVGTKTDLRDDESTLNELKKFGMRSPITEDEGKALATSINATGYMECSALHQKGVKEVFEEVLTVALKSAEQQQEPAEPVTPPTKKKKKGKCEIM
eukprot:TRINITY_DN6089_c0_g1_i1.p1 TRINITY_DN6089_c0_g1~~TRINITY_DN6089_c0_g1_i1.p1  ORF type:complete len:207 (-),score=53.08 TRINITY_DN6089_c0_g1_i1:151-771(-)